MASLVGKQQPREGFGQKVKNIVSAVGTIKGMYDTGKAIYGGMQIAAPYVRMGMAML
jgi:hypothetical protein